MNNTTINSEFKMVPANETTFKEFINKSTDHSYSYGYPNMIGGFSTSSRGEIKALSTTEAISNSNSANRYSETNVQVKGIDEADIVKTNGNYIYYSPERYPIVRYSTKYYYPMEVENHIY
ncbi:Beta propeller domain-containing protein [Methanothermococcus okinawensis IH1]|uniref:Beta propeller domain-containing protein n=2 Tax=Methanothermococcus okinawensis TaxID=155863 RepID=F8AKP1_METOI|nr:Beta propeller domain-containing protein [Methanothermococcus okinawensis IH1]